MRNYCRLLGKMFMLLIIAVLIGGCAVVPYINVNYNFSEPSDSLGGHQVYIDFKDGRSDQTILGKDTQSYFKDFNGKFHLFIVQDDKDKEFKGSYDLKNLFKEAMSFRLTNYGAQVVKTRTENSAMLEIELKKFALNLKDKRWITSVEYAARLVYAKDAYVGETISATAERQKIWGRKDAEKTLSEAITDTVNKLNIPRLFEKSGL